MKKIYFFVALLLSVSASAQCPYFSTCPASQQLYCDYTTNDTLFWNAPPFTFHPGLMQSDLSEGQADIGVLARDSCGGFDVGVEYTLFLDLDGNDTVETVVRSNAVLPPGKLLYNNILSPNYALGDTIAFDHRAGVPDSMKYRFGLELTRIADLVIANVRWTTGEQNAPFSVPTLPLGKHRILWRIAQGGGEAFCEYPLLVKDCAPPVVNCVAPFTAVLLPPAGQKTLDVNDFLLDNSDNVTSGDKMLLSIRPHGAPGTGFPVDGNGDPITSITWGCDRVGQQAVVLWAKDLAGNTDSCTAFVEIGDPGDFCDLVSNFSARAVTHSANEGIENVLFRVESTGGAFGQPFSRISYTDTAGQALFVGLSLGGDLTLTPARTDNPLNGVTTFDLVLISKHILGTEPLDSPYKIIAADVNKSNSVTTFDIVQLRKLILGIEDTLANNTSWRFVAKEYVFANANSPFDTIFPEKIHLNEWMGTPDMSEFYGIKIGDLNNTAVPNFGGQITPENREVCFLSLPDEEMRAGEIREISLCPVKKSGVLGWQMALDYDPEQVDIQWVESAVLPGFDASCWAKPASGTLAMSWSAANAVTVLPQENVVRLRILARSDLRLSEVFGASASRRLRSEWYDHEGIAQDLQVVFSPDSADPLRVFPAQPNPTSSGALLPIQLAQAENLRFEVYDFSGKLLWFNELKNAEGSHLLEIPASAMPHAGVFVWRLKAGVTYRTGKITRL